MYREAMSSPSIKRLAVPCLLGWLLCASLDAQTFQAQVTGTVTDSSGAVVPGAQIIATNTATAATYSTTTNDTGVYHLPYLPPAVYRISCTLAGFKYFEEGPITLQVTQVFQLDVSLQPGPVSEKVTVTGETSRTVITVPAASTAG